MNMVVADDSALNRKYLIRIIKNFLETDMNSVLEPTFIEYDDGIDVVNHLKNSVSKYPDIIFLDNIMNIILYFFDQFSSLKDHHINTYKIARLVTRLLMNDMIIVI
jgi:hypothetical protein